MAFKPIEILINAKDNASEVFDGLKSKVGAVAAAIAAYLGVNAFTSMVRGAADFEQALSGVQAATGATAEEMAQLRKAAEGLEDFGGVEAAQALENLGKAGLSASDAIAALKPSADLAKAGQIGLGQASEALTQVIFGLGLSFKDSARVADVLAAGANATKTSVAGLTQALSYAAPVANSLGMSLESTVALLGQFAQGGIDASRAGTALNSIMSQFLDPASKFRNELAAAGITTNDFEKALHQLAAAGPAGAKAINAVGLESGPALRAMLNLGMGALDDLVLKLKNAEGSAAATAAVMRNNLNGSLSSLGKAWEYLTNTLGTPVLPVLKDGVDQLTAAFRGAVADGTVTKFGEAIATAFSAGLKYVREFIASVDMDAVIARIRVFADDAQVAFGRIGEYATNTGNTVKVAYGVMAGGVNSVLAAIYGLGSVFADTLAQIQGGISLLYEWSSKLSFGALSKQWADIAAEIRLSAEATAASAQALRDKASNALEQVADSAQIAKNGFMGLATEVSKSIPAFDASARAASALAKEQAAGAEAAAKAGAAYQKKVNDDQLAARAADDHSAAIKKLRAEYDELVARGSLQGAAQKLQEINKALAGTPPAAKDAAKAAADAASQIEAAFERLGVASAATLAKQATAAKADYETIKKAGTSTAEDISAAFAKAAEAAIAANKGIAPSWVTAEAGVRGYRIEVDAAGKSHLELINKAAPGLDRLAKGWQMSREAIQAQEDAMDKLMMKYTMSANYTERQIALLEREAAAAEKAAEAYRKKWNMDKEGYSLNTAGERVLAGETEQDVSDDVARLYGEQNRDNEKARRARQLRALGRLRSIGNGLVTQRDFSADERRELDQLEAEIFNPKPEKAGGTTSATTPTGSSPSAASQGGAGGATRSQGSGISSGQVVTHRVLIEEKGQQPMVVNTSDQQSANTLIEALRRGKGTAR